MTGDSWVQREDKTTLRLTAVDKVTTLSHVSDCCSSSTSRFLPTEGKGRSDLLTRHSATFILKVSIPVSILVFILLQKRSTRTVEMGSLFRCQMWLVILWHSTTPKLDRTWKGRQI